MIEESLILPSLEILTSIRRAILLFNFLDLKKEAVVSDLDHFANILSSELLVSTPILNNKDKFLTNKSLR